MHLTKVFESIEATYWVSWLSFDVQQAWRQAIKTALNFRHFVQYPLTPNRGDRVAKKKRISAVSPGRLSYDTLNPTACAVVIAIELCTFTLGQSSAPSALTAGDGCAPHHGISGVTFVCDLPAMPEIVSNSGFLVLDRAMLRRTITTSRWEEDENSKQYHLLMSPRSVYRTLSTVPTSGKLTRYCSLHSQHDWLHSAWINFSAGWQATGGSGDLAVSTPCVSTSSS